MKTSFIALGAFASFASFVAASPAADAAAQLEGRDPIICIGCVNMDCPKESVPAHCNVDTDDILRDCERYCFFVAAGCRCCDVVNGESVNCG